MGSRTDLIEVYIPFWKWEDYQNGMYSGSIDKSMIKHCVELLVDQPLFYEVAKQVTHKWNYSCLEQLTKRSKNKIAWLGQASCCYQLGANEKTTKSAWKQIPPKFQIDANETAKKVLSEYYSRNKQLHKKMGRKMLF